MIPYVQLIPTLEVDGNVRTATPDEVERDACLWSVYIGEPGGFSWVADFGEHIDAHSFALSQCEMHNAQLMEGGTA